MFVALVCILSGITDSYLHLFGSNNFFNHIELKRKNPNEHYHHRLDEGLSLIRFQVIA